MKYKITVQVRGQAPYLSTFKCSQVLLTVVPLQEMGMDWFQVAILLDILAAFEL